MQALWANVKSLLSAYDARAQTVRKATLLFRHHPGLQASRAGITAQIAELLQMQRFEEALPAIVDLGRHAEASLLYLQRYHWLLLYTVIVVQYLLWMLWLVLEVLRDGGVSAAAPGADDGATAAWVAWAWKAELGLHAAAAVAFGVMMTLGVPVCALHAYVGSAPLTPKAELDLHHASRAITRTHSHSIHAWCPHVWNYESRSEAARAVLPCMSIELAG